MKVKNDKKPDKNVINTKEKDEYFQVKFLDEKWVKGCTIKKHNFSNKYNSYEEMNKYIILAMTKLIIFLQDRGYDIIKKGSWYHQNSHNCHEVTEAKKEVVNDIIEDIYEGTLEIETDSENKILWQFGVNQDLRIICLYDKAVNALYPLFIDPFHLIHQSIKYNQEDHMTNRYCAYKLVFEN